MSSKEKEVEKTDNEKGKSDGVALVFQAFIRLITALIEGFGWSGTLAISGFWFVVWYATPEQKQRIIDMYVLGVGIWQVVPLIIISILFTTVALAQRRWYLKKIETLTEEIEREGKEKSKLQSSKIDKQLKHATTRTKSGGK